MGTYITYQEHLVDDSPANFLVKTTTVFTGTGHCTLKVHIDSEYDYLNLICLVRVSHSAIYIWDDSLFYSPKKEIEILQ